MLWATRSAGWVTRKRHVPRPAAHRLLPQPITAGRFAPAGYPAYSRSHNIWAHARHTRAPTATWTARGGLQLLTPAPRTGWTSSSEDPTDSEEEEEGEADGPAVLAARLLHLRAPATDLATFGLLNE